MKKMVKEAAIEKILEKQQQVWTKGDSGEENGVLYAVIMAVHSPHQEIPV